MKLQQLALFLWGQYWLSNHLWSIILSFCEAITRAIAAWKFTEVQNAWTDSLYLLGAELDCTFYSICNTLEPAECLQYTIFV